MDLLKKYKLTKDILSINRYQNNSHRHPMTCTCGDHIVLDPIIQQEEIVLECSICGRTQKLTKNQLDYMTIFDDYNPPSSFLTYLNLPGTIFNIED